MRPIALSNFEQNRLIGSRPIYVTFRELYNWAVDMNLNTVEGQPYHDALEIINEALSLAESLWSGTITIPNPIDPADTITFPAFLAEGQMLEVFQYEYSNRYIGWPLFNRAYHYKDDNNEEWYQVCKVFSGKLSRAVTECGNEYYKKLRAIAIEYNPIEDYWSKSIEKGGNAPYASIADGTDGTDITSWTTSNGKSEYKNTNELGDDGITNEHQTSTQDSTQYRAESKDIQKGTTTNKNETPNSGYFRRRSEEGNRGTPIADLIKKEYELGDPIGELFDEFMRKITNKVLLEFWVIDAPTALPQRVVDTLTIVVQPESQIVLVNNGFLLDATTVSSDDSAVLFYQWQTYASDRWVNLPGENDAHFIGAFTSVKTIQYRCVISSDKGGQIVSNVATITSVLSDTITITQQPVSGTAYISSGATPFYVEAVSNIPEASFTYQWYQKSGNSWGQLAGATSNPYNYTAASNPETRTFRCRIRSNFGGEVYSEEFTMTYLAVPIPGQKFIIANTNSSPTYMSSVINANGGFENADINTAGRWEFTNDNRIKLSGTDTYIELIENGAVALTTTGTVFSFIGVTYNRTNNYWQCQLTATGNKNLRKQSSSAQGWKWDATPTSVRIFFVE